MEIYCTARFLAKDGCKDDLINALALLVPDTKKESGCIRYELMEEIIYEGNNNETWHLCLIEHWKTREDFDAHCKMSYIKNFFDVTAKMYVEKIDVRLYHQI